MRSFLIFAQCPVPKFPFWWQVFRNKHSRLAPRIITFKSWLDHLPISLKLSQKPKLNISWQCATKIGVVGFTNPLAFQVRLGPCLLLECHVTYCTVHKIALLHCTVTMCTFSWRPNTVGHDITLPYCDIIQHVFIPTRSVARKTLLWRFSWASSSKCAIFPELYPCSNYGILAFFTPISVLIHGNSIIPRIIHRGILLYKQHTVHWSKASKKVI